MKKGFRSRVMNPVTAICLLTICLCLNEFYVSDKGYRFDNVEDDPGRNENSTPRTLILPATPAVAREQERKKEFINRHDEIMRCIVALDDTNFMNLKGLDDIFDIRVTVALIEYQSEKKINVTAEFDPVTKKRLGCS